MRVRVGVRPFAFVFENVGVVQMWRVVQVRVCVRVQVRVSAVLLLPPLQRKTQNHESPGTQPKNTANANLILFLCRVGLGKYDLCFSASESASELIISYKIFPIAKREEDIISYTDSASRWGIQVLITNLALTFQIIH